MLSRQVDLGVCRRSAAAVTAIDKCLVHEAPGGLETAQQRPVQGMAIVRIARQGVTGDNEVAAQRRRHADLHAEFIRLARLALADALDLRRVQAVQLAPILALLLQQAVRQSQLVREDGLLL